MFSQGEVPYKDLTPVEVAIAVVKDDRRLAQPKRCPDALFVAMQRCWSAEPSTRPSMSELVELLTRLYDQPVVVDDESDS